MGKKYSVCCYMDKEANGWTVALLRVSKDKHSQKVCGKYSWNWSEKALNTTRCLPESAWSWSSRSVPSIFSQRSFKANKVCKHSMWVYKTRIYEFDFTRKQGIKFNSPVTLKCEQEFIINWLCNVSNFYYSLIILWRTEIYIKLTAMFVNFTNDFGNKVLSCIAMSHIIFF